MATPQRRTSIGLKKFTCEYCMRHFPTQSSLKTHKKSHNIAAEDHSVKGTNKPLNPTKPSLNVTPKKTPVNARPPHGACTPNAARRPAKDIPRTSQTPEHHLCKKCQKRFPSRPQLVKHACSHAGDTPTTKRQRFLLQSHPDTRQFPAQRPTATATPFKCEICKKRFRQSAGLNAHVLTHVNTIGYNHRECLELCPDTSDHQEVDNTKNKETHQVIDIENRENVQQNINKEMSEASETTRQNSRPFGTSIHDLNKAVKSDIDMRLRAYFDTTIDCDSVESDLFPYRCTVCNLGFNVISELLEHSVLHTRDKPYTCGACAKSFGNCKTMILHQKVHAITKLKGILEERRDIQT